MLTVVRRRGVSGPKFQRFQVVLLRNALLYYLCSPSNHSACCVCCVSLFDPFPDRISRVAAAGLPVFAVAAAAYSRPDFSVSRVMSSAWERDTITSNLVSTLPTLFLHCIQPARVYLLNWKKKNAQQSSGCLSPASVTEPNAGPKIKDSKEIYKEMRSRQSDVRIYLYDLN
jgi:hypothetical protein